MREGRTQRRTNEKRRLMMKGRKQEDCSGWRWRGGFVRAGQCKEAEGGHRQVIGVMTEAIGGRRTGDHCGSHSGSAH